MSYVINFKQYRPSARKSGLWTQAAIQQAAVDPSSGEPGGFTTIETQSITSLYPQYTNPASPPTMDFQTELGTLLPGWYRIVFVDATGDTEETAPKLWQGSLFRPSTRDVAVHIKNRTVDENNEFLGDFVTGQTSVSKEEVEELIGKAESRVLRRMDLDPNVTIPTESAQAVKDAIALYAAMLVELTKYSEQVARGASPFEHLRDLFNETLPELREDITGIPATTSSGGGAGNSAMDLYQGSGVGYGTFPEDRGGMISWGTKF